MRSDGRAAAGTSVLVAAGGALGGLLRHALTQAAPHGPAGLDGTVLGINALGSFLLGLLVTGLLPAGAPRWLRPLLGTGLLGGFTTFSAVAHTVDLAAGRGDAVLGGTYLLASLVAGFLSAALGVVIGSRWAAGRGADGRGDGRGADGRGADKRGADERGAGRGPVRDRGWDA